MSVAAELLEQGRASTGAEGPAARGAIVEALAHLLLDALDAEEGEANAGRADARGGGTA